MPNKVLFVGAHHPMRIPLIVRIKAFFARDKDAFWWNHYTDEERQLRRMDVWQLAKIINEARVRNLGGEPEQLIVAEHMLSERLARIQARPAWYAIAGGLLGMVGGAFLTSALQKPDTQTKCVCECQHRSPIQQNVAAPVRETISPVVAVGVPEVNGIQKKGKPEGKMESESNL